VGQGGVPPSLWATSDVFVVILEPPTEGDEFMGVAYPLSLDLSPFVEHKPTSASYQLHAVLV